jgi:outer membrane protein TolC
MTLAPLASRAEGEGPSARSLRLADLLVELREHNPELKAAGARAEAMAAVPPQARALDDPTFTYEAWNVPESLRIDRADNNIFRLSQKLPFPGKRDLRGAVAVHEAERASYEASALELDVTAELKRAYASLWEAHARLVVLEREKELLQRFSHVAEQKYGVGEATQADVLRAQVELTHVINKLRTEPLAIASARAEINSLLSRSPEEPLGAPEHPEPPRLADSPQSLARLALENRPELRAQEAMVAREESAQALAEKAYYPDFEVSVGRFVNDAAPDGFGAMASVTLPFLNRSKYDAGAEEARARLSQARFERRRLEDRIRREVEQTWLEARTALLQYELFVDTHVPQAEQALRVAEGAYETNELGFLDLVDTLRRLESVHLEHVAAQASFERAYADLERVVGAELPRALTPARDDAPSRAQGSPHD